MGERTRQEMSLLGFRSNLMALPRCHMVHAMFTKISNNDGFSKLKVAFTCTFRLLVNSYNTVYSTLIFDTNTLKERITE